MPDHKLKKLQSDNYRRSRFVASNEQLHLEETSKLANSRLVFQKLYIPDCALESKYFNIQGPEQKNLRGLLGYKLFSIRK